MSKDKEELAQELNSILETDIDFQKLTAADLKALHEVFTTPGKFGPIAMRIMMKMPSKLRENLGIGKRQAGTGFFGFGFLPGPEKVDESEPEKKET